MNYLLEKRMTIKQSKKYLKNANFSNYNINQVTFKN